MKNCRSRGLSTSIFVAFGTTAWAVACDLVRGGPADKLTCDCQWRYCLCSDTVLSNNVTIKKKEKNKTNKKKQGNTVPTSGELSVIAFNSGTLNTRF